MLSLSMKKFRIQPYMLGELARLYCPDRDYQSALRLFHKDLQETRGLKEALGKTGYSGDARLFTRNQVKVIVKFLGEP